MVVSEQLQDPLSRGVGLRVKPVLTLRSREESRALARNQTTIPRLSRLQCSHHTDYTARWHWLSTHRSVYF